MKSSGDKMKKTQLEIRDHPESGYVAINGINFAYEIFQHFAMGMMDDWFRIVSREDGLVTITKQKEGEIVSNRVAGRGKRIK